MYHNALGGKSGAFASVGDFDNDGNLDLIVSPYHTSPKIEVLLGDGTGDFTLHWAAPMLPIPQSMLTGLAVGDFDNNGSIDLAAGYYKGTFNSRDIQYFLTRNKTIGKM